MITYTKSGAALLSLLMLLAVAWPVQENWKPAPKDNFPLSYFPMFSAKRAKTYKLYYVVGYDENGVRQTIPYKLIGKGGFNQVRRQIRKCAKDGKGEALLQKVAGNLSNKSKYRHIQCLDLVEGKYHVERYFREGRKVPLSEVLIAHQPIEKP